MREPTLCKLPCGFATMLVPTLTFPISLNINSGQQMTMDVGPLVTKPHYDFFLFLNYIHKSQPP